MSNLRERIKNELAKRGALHPCARCGKQKFALLEDFARVDQQKEFTSINLGGPSVPCAVVVCENCGNVSLHALGALGFMDEITPKDEVPKSEGGNNE